MKNITDFIIYSDNINETKSFKEMISLDNVKNLPTSAWYSNGKISTENSPKGKLIKKEGELSFEVSKYFNDFPSSEYSSFDEYYNEYKDVMMCGYRFYSKEYLKAMIKDLENFLNSKK